MRISIIVALLTLLIASHANASTFNEAMLDAAEHFKAYLKQIPSDREIVFKNIINLNTKSEDALGRKIKQTLNKSFQGSGIDIQPSEAKPQNETGLILSGAYIRIKNQIRLKISLSEAKRVHTEFEAEFEAEQPVQKPQIVIADIETDLIPDVQRSEYSQRYRKILCEALLDRTQIESSAEPECTSRIRNNANAVFIVSTFLIKLNENSYLLYAKSIDPQSKSVKRSESIEVSGPLEALDESLNELARQLAVEQNNQIPTLRESIMSRSEWHITALSITALALWMANSETSKYNELSAENSEIKTQYLQATAQDEISSLENEYDDNTEKMEQHEQTIMQMYAVAALAVGWEIYLLYQTYRDSTEPEQISNADPIRFKWVPVRKNDSTGLKLSLSWNF